MTFNQVIDKLSKFLVASTCTSLIIASTATPNYAARKSVCSFITGRTVNIRSGPGTNYRVVASLRRADVVRASHRQGNWVRITARVFGNPPRERVTAFNGWVSNQYINGCSEDQFDRWRR
ncbi:MAG: SH3 domain-containing protein [Scytonematopsis contorta HA4267-MV1]|jgi:uncharacterized protein YraI|nr:SH3 domain-containing protein [Scytonematopsis contorta HA4267-MV1]